MSSPRLPSRAPPSCPRACHLVRERLAAVSDSTSPPYPRGHCCRVQEPAAVSETVVVSKGPPLHPIDRRLIRELAVAVSKSTPPSRPRARRRCVQEPAVAFKNPCLVREHAALFERTAPFCPRARYRRLRDNAAVIFEWRPRARRLIRELVTTTSKKKPPLFARARHLLVRKPVPVAPSESIESRVIVTLPENVATCLPASRVAVLSKLPQW